MSEYHIEMYLEGERAAKVGTILNMEYANNKEKTLKKRKKLY